MSESTVSNGGYVASVERLLSRGSGGGQAAVESAGSGFLGLSDALSGNSSAIAQLHAAIQAQSESLLANTKALAENRTGQTNSSGESKAATVAKTVGTSLLGGLTLAPLVRGLMSIFGGGDSPAPAPLPKFELPSALQINAGLSSSTSGPVAVDYDQFSNPRPVQTSAAPAQVTVNVQALDSQSFLDRSDDIARAVKRAMLESSSLNDVIAEV